MELMTRGFSVYIKYSADNSKMYGSMTSVVLIIIWLYIGMQICFVWCRNQLLSVRSDLEIPGKIPHEEKAKREENKN